MKIGLLQSKLKKIGTPKEIGVPIELSRRHAYFNMCAVLDAYIISVSLYMLKWHVILLEQKFIGIN